MALSALATAGRTAWALVEVISSYFSTPVQVKVPVDLTKTREETGTEVVETVVDRIGRSGIFGPDFGYIRRVCWVETKDGADAVKTFREDYHGGLWQVDEKFFLQTKDTSTYPILLEKHEEIKSKLDIDWTTVKWEDLRAPLYCGLAAWLYMCTRKDSIPLNIEEQAEFHKKNYEKPDDSSFNKMFVEAVAVMETIKEDEKVNIALDLYIVLDSSGSIGSSSYEEAKKFLADLVGGFIIGKSNVRVGLVIYGSNARLIFDLKHSYDKDEILSSIQSVEYLSSSTATGDAIRLMTTTGFTEEHGVRASVEAIPRVAIVLTDGESDSGQDVPEAAQSARDQSIKMLAFGIGSGINERELLEIAGSQDGVFRIDRFKNIDDVRAQITRGCKKYAVVKADVEKIYEGNVNAKEKRYFEFPITTDLTFEIKIHGGKVALYGSYTNPNPSKTWHDYKPDIDEYLKLPVDYPSEEEQKEGFNGLFYCCLVGEEDFQFSIEATAVPQE